MRLLGWLTTFALALIPMRAIALVAYKLHLNLKIEIDDGLSLLIGAAGAWLSYVVHRTLVANKHKV